jgi:hypothetical protein
MKYILVWCHQLGIFALEQPFSPSREQLTEAEMRSKCGDNVLLHAWVDFAKQHPNVEVVYDMLPK